MEKDIAEKRLEEYNDVFADIFNNLVFQGDKVLEEDKLTSMPTEAVTRKVGGKLYFGSDWTGPRRLHEMLEFPEELRERLEKLVPDYHMNLIEVKNLPEEVRQRLTSDFRLIAEYVACRNQPKKLEALLADKKQVIKHPEEFFDLLELITSDKRFIEAKEMLTEEERKGGVTMCTGLDRIENRGIAKGKEIGKEIGEKEERQRML